MRLSIVQNSHAVLENLKLILGGETAISIVGAFSTGKEALRGLKRTSTEAVLADLDLPDMPGIEFIQRARDKMPDLDILVYTHIDDRERVLSAFRAGASGYLLRGTRPRELIEALMGLHQGGAPMSPKIARMVVLEFQKEGTDERCLITERERDVLLCLNKRMNYREIANTLRISPYTVRTHIRNIYEKLPAKSKEEALSKAKRNGVI